MIRRLAFFACVLFVAVLPGTAALAADGAPSAARGAAIQRLMRESAVKPVLRFDDRTSGIKWLTGRWAAPAPGHPVESSYRFLEANRAAFGIVSPRDELVPLQVATDDQLAGWRDVFLRQRVHGIPVLHAQIAFHYDGDGRLVAVNGSYSPSPRDISTPKLDGREAVNRALAASAVLPSIDDETELGTPAGTTEPPALSEPPSARLVYYAFPAGGLRLAYEVGLVGVDLSQAWTIIVDARSGAVLERVSEVQAVGRGIDLFSRKVRLNTSKVGGAWKLIDRSQYMFKHHSKHPYTKFEGCIEVRDAQHKIDAQGEGIAKPNYPTVKDPNGDNFFNHGGSDPKKNQRSAVSLAQNLTTTYKTMRARLGRNSVDGRGLSVVGNVHLGNSYENAYWSGDTQMMYFGDNAPDQPPYTKSLDVVAHEYGHGITRFSVPGGGLAYHYPSGAISEAFSDIWGCTVDYKNWTMGEALGASMRNMAEPAANSLPASMWEYQLMVLPQDNGGNHINCTIGGHFFQLLAAALPASPPAQDGRYTAAKIVYRSYPYMSATSSYRDWGLALVQAANDIYGPDAAETAATRTVLTQLGISTLDFGQNDNGWCLDESGEVIAMQWSRAANMCYLAEKFTTPAGAKLARVYVALNNDPSYTWIESGQALRVFVVGVAADGGPELATVLDYETLGWDSIQEPGRFTPVSMTAEDFVTPRNLDVPQQFFVLVGFFPDDSDINTMIMLEDDGSSPGPPDQNWIVSTGLDWNTLDYYWIRQTHSQWSGMNNTLNFMIRPMYSYDAGATMAAADPSPPKAGITPAGVGAIDGAIPGRSGTAAGIALGGPLGAAAGL